MKCVCGYERNEEDDNTKWEDEKFIRINCHVTIEKSYGQEEVNLFACPKCGTVKMVKW